MRGGVEVSGHTYCICQSGAKEEHYLPEGVDPRDVAIQRLNTMKAALLPPNVAICHAQDLFAAPVGTIMQASIQHRSRIKYQGSLPKYLNGHEGRLLQFGTNSGQLHMTGIFNVG